MEGFRGRLISISECQRARLEMLAASGDTAVCIPIAQTRTALQSVADEANRLGLAVYGWIELGSGAGIGELRRLVEAYPHLDGYFVSGLPPEVFKELSGYLLIPILNEVSHVPQPGFGPLAAVSLDILQKRTNFGGCDLIAIIPETPESEINSVAAGAESSGASGVLIVPAHSSVFESIPEG